MAGMVEWINGVKVVHPAQSPVGRSENFYHGTTHNITDVVRPANDVDRHVSEYSMGDPGDLSEGDHAFAIKNDENYAWHAANTFHPGARRPRVYEVEPAKDMVPGPWNKDHPNFLEHHGLDDPDSFHVAPGSDDEPYIKALREEVEEKRANHQDEWASPTGFPVRKRIDIMPGRQGTFPQTNWNRFKKDGPYGGPDVNHPTHEQVQYGTKGHPQNRSGNEYAEAPSHLNGDQFHDWRKDPAPHSELREAAGRPQKRWATLLD